jgi:CheY-like chemotaxis protein
VPRRIVFDTASAVGRTVAGEIRLTDLFQRFQAHYIMPRMTGREFLKKLRLTPALQQMPVVLVTGAAHDPRVFPPEGTYQAVLGKPFKIGELVETVRTVLGQDAPAPVVKT